MHPTPTTVRTVNTLASGLVGGTDSFDPRIEEEHESPQLLFTLAFVKLEESVFIHMVWTTWRNALLLMLKTSYIHFIIVQILHQSRAAFATLVRTM